jgi:hypothetical protein
MASSSHEETLVFHTMHINIHKFVTFKMKAASDDKCALIGSVGLSLPATNGALSGFQIAVHDSCVEMEWPGAGQLNIQHSAVDGSVEQHRYDFTWTSFTSKVLQDVFQLHGSHWYGAAQVKVQKWPLERWQMRTAPFVAGDSFKDSLQFGGVQERYFLSSSGVALFVDDDVPLWVGINGDNDRLLRLTAKFQSPYKNPTNKLPFLRYSILQSYNVHSVHELVMNTFIAHPSDIPDERMFRHPIWSTWATYKKNINQAKVLEFAREIRRRDFEAAQLEIDDDWTPAYGDMEFDRRKFPNPGAMMDELRSMGLRVTLWVHPFASVLSSAVARGDFWVKSTVTRGVTTWWNGLGKCLDVTNPAAVAWFRGCLRALADEYGIASFKFDAGELNWLPPGHSFHAEVSTPNEYTRKYAEMCAGVDRDLRALEIRVGVQTQRLPVFVRMMDKESTWGEDNGLATLIPHALTFGILGYPFVLPDMVGGNAYHGLPDRELYVRWMEANALLPAIQISIPPWQYDDEVVKITHDMLKVRETYADLMVQLARDSTRTGAPIVRPLWWIAPYDDTAQMIDSEFLLGDDLLVAPVLERGATSRLVYLPAGRWRHVDTGCEIDGPKWHRCPAEIDQLPVFQRSSAVEELQAAKVSVDQDDSFVAVEFDDRVNEAEEETFETDKSSCRSWELV